VSLSTAAFARILARVERELEIAPALAEAGITEDEWAAEKAAFALAARERPREVSLELAQAFAQARADLAGDAKPDEPPEPLDSKPSETEAEEPAPTRASPPEPGSPIATPTYLKQESPLLAPTQPDAPLDPDATLPIPIPVATRPALPFSGDNSVSRLRELAEQAPRPNDLALSPDETVIAPVQVALVSPASGSFRDALAPVVVPQLSLAAYADLRARLVVFGEDHDPSLRHYGVVSTAAKEAVERGFRARFENDAELRGRFESAIRERVRHHRGGS